MEVPDLYNVFVTKDGDTGVEVDDKKQTKIDKANYLEECFLLQYGKRFTLDTGS